jgi:hypothetical protein
MTPFNDIPKHAVLARKLADLRLGVLDQLEFTDYLKRTRFDLSRVASPVVAVVGASSAGKSALINAVCGHEILPVNAVPTTLVPVRLRGGVRRESLIGTGDGSVPGPVSAAEIRALITNPRSAARYVVWQDPAASAIPWEWLDMPGSSVLPPKDISLQLTPRDLADVCVLATSALQPLPFGDLRHCIQLGEVFAGANLVVALTRCDQLGPDELDSVRSYVAGKLKEALPGRAVTLLAVSATSRSGIPELTQHLATVLRDRQREQLAHEIAAWRTTMGEIKDLVDLRELADLQLPTIETARTQLRAVLYESGGQLKLKVPRIVEDATRQIAHSLPASERAIFVFIRQQLLACVSEDLRRISQLLMKTLANALARDLPNPRAVNTVLARIGAVSQPNLPDLFDRSSAIVGLGMGAALGAIAPLFAAAAGVAVAIGLAGGLAGSLIGGFAGTGQNLITPNDVRALVGHPLTTSALSELDRVFAFSAHEIDRTCALLKKVVQVYAKPEHRISNPDVIPSLLRAADLSLQEIDAGFRTLDPAVHMQAVVAAAKTAPRKRPTTRSPTSKR